jgi:Tfp pilus assembly protein PilV
MGARTFRPRQAGFTVIEAVVTMAVMAPMLLGLYSLLESSNRITKQESNVAQARGLRGGITRSPMIRRARVGPLYYGNAVLPIYDNAPARARRSRDTSGADHRIRRGTDVVEARGIILGESSPSPPAT